MIREASWTGTEALTTADADVALTLDNKEKGPIYLGTLWLYVTTIAAATALNVKLSRDANGDELITPPYTTDLNAGETTATDGTAIVDLSGIPFYGSDTYYVWVSTDAGTATLTEARLTLVE